MSKPLVLGIESSCDETGIGIVRGTELLANQVASSMDQHAIFGGVIPEIAARAHVQAMRPTLQAALDTAGVRLEEIDAIAVTAGPGLNGALMVGVATAKALSLATGKPLYGINHLVAHVGVALLEGSQLPPRLGALLVSGGHTEILKISSLTREVQLLGATLDDAAGEAYDKVARMLGLGYPGGPVIDRLARQGNPKAVRYPRGLTLPKFVGTAEEPGKHRHDFSFSGLKTAVSRSIEHFHQSGQGVPIEDVCASFQYAVADVLTSKAVRACQESGLDHLLLGGGVAANSGLRELLEQRCRSAGISLRVPPISLCTDNGAMVAALGAACVADGVEPSGLGFATNPSLPVTTISIRESEFEA